MKPAANLKDFQLTIGPILKKSCIQCHGPDETEAKLRIDSLDPNLITGKDVNWWLEVFAVVSNGEMPPPDGPELSNEDRSRVINWLSRELQIASSVRRADESHTAFRRLTKDEFNYSIQDLLGLDWNFSRDLPPEATSDDGFENSSEMLHMTSGQLETYRQLSRVALERATVAKNRPEAIYWSISMKVAARIDFKNQLVQIESIKKKFRDNPVELKQQLKTLENGFRQTPTATHFHNVVTGHKATATWSYPKAKHAILPSKTPPPFNSNAEATREIVAVIAPGQRQGLTIELGDQVPDRGVMRVKVHASRRATSPKIFPSLQLHFGWQASNEGRSIVRVSREDTRVTGKIDAPQIITWDVPLDDIYPRNSVKNKSKLGDLPSPSEYIRLINSSAPGGNDDGRLIEISKVEVIAPFFDQWPPPSHQVIFPTELKDEKEESYVRQVLQRFMKRSWRREIQPKEIEQKIDLFRAIRNDCESTEQAVIEVLSTVLASPNFLYLTRAKNPDPQDKMAFRQLSSFELATRLSFFLWSSLPDDRLLKLAAQDELREPRTLVQEAERMLLNPKAKRLSRQFVRQWLNMQIFDFLNLKSSFRGFDPLLKEAMAQEPIEFFREVLRNNDSVLDFIHADYIMANERLARHYGVKGVLGNQFQRVSLSNVTNRGGLLTQSSLLAMNSDGTDSHPLKRGVWLLESILNDPPPPPPPAVPEIDLADPDIAAMTLKQRIENHRDHAACRSCHSKIDPWGIALENYDALGKWRDQINGRPIDATSQLFNREELKGINGLKIYLLRNRQDQLIRALVYKMSAYALGRPLAFSDLAEIENITAKVRTQGDGLATLILCIVESDLFRSR